jgi:hypothetical protein
VSKHKASLASLLNLLLDYVFLVPRMAIRSCRYAFSISDTWLRRDALFLRLASSFVRGAILDEEDDSHDYYHESYNTDDPVDYEVLDVWATDLLAGSLSTETVDTL